MKPVQATRATLEQIELHVCEIIAKQMALPRGKVRPESRLIEDLHLDSLEVVELFLQLEDEFDTELPTDTTEGAAKAVFTRQPFRVRDLAELIYLRLDAGPRRPARATRGGWLFGSRGSDPAPAHTAHPPSGPVPFTQLGGRLPAEGLGGPLYEPIGKAPGGEPLFRRGTDGMRCVRLPATGDRVTVRLGSDQPGSGADESPAHEVALSAFLIDVEPVSTTAFARFLNSIQGVDDATLRAWFVLEPDDRRLGHSLVQRGRDEAWEPVPGAQRWPMVLVSWYGASAYSLWAHQRDWRDDRGEAEGRGAASCLPTEAQWEYAARGAEPRRYPWGDDPPTPALARFGQHQRGRQYAVEQLPLAEVNAPLGLSPFGLHHMAGNVWQWCRDWYDPAFYRREAIGDPCNTSPTGVRSERGGSWIGAADLLRSSYRRGRPPAARGRCLGFRCAAPAAERQ